MMPTYWVIPKIYYLKATPGYWVAKYDADVLSHIVCGMTNGVNMDGLPSEAMSGY